MHSIYNEMLVKLNDYSGVMVKDREDLKRDLATRKLQMEAHMQADMDLMIEKILEVRHPLCTYLVAVIQHTQRTILLCIYSAE
ncbi:hypothetical protein DPMN_125956 [Dreissena polymorpha]|uniref:Uncharacterized protein n=1 Tax=Dreissena polymorpha TaxID=45954 RepID=A0A9D4GYG5_DREPO|nr:hypothetical protein DPMN_125956 [Dreissena polymorpha]